MVNGKCYYPKALKGSFIHTIVPCCIDASLNRPIGPENNDLANFLLVHLTKPYSVNMAEPATNQVHRGEAMYISVIDSIYFAHMVFSSLAIHHLIMITCISYEIILTISLPKYINIAPL